jgi:hypothetical protein
MKQCDCIQQVQENLKEKCGEVDPQINYELCTGKILLEYTVKNAKGKRKSKYIMPQYCPFCGKKYEGEEVAGDGK